MHVIQSGFTYSACEPLTQKTKKEHKNSWYIYQNELDKACFQHDMAYGDFKDLTRKISSDEILHHKTFNIAKNLKYDGYDGCLASMVNKFFDKKTSCGTVENGNISNKKLTEKLQKLIIKKFKKRKVYSPFTNNI